VTDLCALNLPKRGTRSKARDLVGAPPSARDSQFIHGCRRQVRDGAHDIVKLRGIVTAFALLTDLTAYDWLAPTPPSPPGKRLPCGARLPYDPTLWSPSSIRCNLRRRARRNRRPVGVMSAVAAITAGSTPTRRPMAPPRESRDFPLASRYLMILVE